MRLVKEKKTFLSEDLSHGVGNLVKGTLHHFRMPGVKHGQCNITVHLVLPDVREDRVDGGHLLGAGHTLAKLFIAKALAVDANHVVGGTARKTAGGAESVGEDVGGVDELVTSVAEGFQVFDVDADLVGRLFRRW